MLPKRPTVPVDWEYRWERYRADEKTPIDADSGWEPISITSEAPYGTLVLVLLRRKKVADAS